MISNMRSRNLTTLAFIQLLLGLGLPLLAAEALDVSIIQLIAHPNDYDSKVVRLTGFVRLEFEGTGVYLHEDDCRYHITKNGLWLKVSDEIMKNKREFNLKYVLLEGTFNAEDRGHMGAWNGSSEKITRFVTWPRRR